MTIAKKPSHTDKFIQSAKAEINRKVINKPTEKKAVTAKTTKTVRQTFYMDQETYLAWQKYKLDQLATGNRVSFQGVVEQYFKELLA